MTSSVHWETGWKEYTGLEYNRRYSLLFFNDTLFCPDDIIITENITALEISTITICGFRLSDIF
jgi:hypothetical protein